MNEDENEEMPETSQNGDESIPSKEELAMWLSEFMSQGQRAQSMYRQHFCQIVVERLFEEFGIDGMCELMMAIDKRAGWISDIIIEDADIHDALFKNHGVYDDKAISKARKCNEIIELNKKIWRLRRKYAKLIAEEIVNPGNVSVSGQNDDD
jgi:hypothetical protein